MTAYLDHAATTPMRPEAVEAMLPFLAERFGNPSGSHAVARDAKKAIEEGRDTVAACLGCEPGEVVFTGSGTEADNLAVLGVATSRSAAVLCTAVVHHAVLHACEAVGGRTVPVGADAVIDLDRLADALSPEISLVSVMLVNNEVGTVQPLSDVLALVRERAPEAVVHTDAVQAVSWLDVAAEAGGAGLVAIGAHKFGGPKGVGALVVREGVRVSPLIHGGGQERERRSGTHNVAGIVAMAAALRVTVEERAATVERVASRRNRLADGLVDAIDGAEETGTRETKVAGNCHLTFADVESEELLMLLDAAGVYASAGSACASGALEPSHVLAAMGVSRQRARGSLRLSLGSTTTDADVDLALEAVPAAVARLRGARPS